MLAEYLKPTPRPLDGDRSHTVGASEIGQCARQVWFKKHGVVPETEEKAGYSERGHVVEAWAVQKLREQGVPIQSVQRRYTQGFLSCTVDLVLNDEPVDLKSIDPRVTRLPKPAHVLQAQTQAGLLGASRGHLCYIDCSDFDRVTEFTIDHDPALFTSLQTRAREIMTGPMPAPEGRIAGGDECQWCPFQVACLGAPIEGRGRLTDEDTAVIASARATIKALQDEAEKIEHDLNRHKEIIRETLRIANVKRAPGLARISRNKGKQRLDIEAMEAAGIDLAPYRTLGRPSESVTIE